MEEALVVDVFIDKEALRASDAATKQLDEVLVVDFAYQVDFAEELVNPLSRVEDKPLDSYNPPIW